MNYSTDFVAGVVADKYVSHMPLERQTREMESLGLSGIKNSTLSRLCGLAAACLEPLHEKILREAGRTFEGNFCHARTTIQKLKQS
jgi:hypothetical protein